ncbi:MAG: aspartate/glutamate racemase family protein [Betaproteobacteria bacterium]
MCHHCFHTCGDASSAAYPAKATQVLGILSLDTQFPRIPGDVGAPETFAFPVRLATVEGANVDAIVHRHDDALLTRFGDAARALGAAGCLGVTTTCGFLVRWQQALARAAGVPVLTSALLQLPVIARCVAPGRRVGVVTYSAPDLTSATLAAAGADIDTPIQGVDPDGYFANTIRHGRATLDRALMAADVIAAGQRLMTRHPDMGAIVLECANMPPYRDAVATALGLPVFDATHAIAWFYSGLPGTAPRYGRSNLW